MNRILSLWSSRIYLSDYTRVLCIVSSLLLLGLLFVYSSSIFNSKKLFPKLASFKNSFNTKLIAIISQKEKGYIQSIEITHHILYKPFTFNDLDYCLKNCSVDKKKGEDDSELKQKIFQKLDIVEKDHFDFQYKQTFKDNSVVRMEDVRQELYDDINVLDSNVESELTQTANIFSDSKNKQYQFSPEVKLQAKRKDTRGINKK